MRNILHWQTKAREYMPTLRLPVKSPYFQMIDVREEASRQEYIFILELMKAIAGIDYAVSGSNTYVGVAFYTGNVLTTAQNIQFDMADSTDGTSLVAAAETAINAYATTNNYSLTEGIFWTYPVAPGGLSHAPQAAITDSPADATTNYNVITTLLGSLTGAVNTANTKQNAIAVQLNTLLAELRTLGLIST